MILKRDDTFRIVFQLRTFSPCGTKEEIGTGIFLSKDNGEVFMITATHVALNCTTQTNVLLGHANSATTSLRLTNFNQYMAWKHHPIADISVLPVIQTEQIQDHLPTERFMPFDHFHLDETPPSRDLELTSVGFPNGLGAKDMFSPLTYRSYASSAFITLNRPGTNTPNAFFLLENPSVGGYSGCPILDLGYRIVGAMTTSTNKDNKTRCYGIMHGTISDDTGGKLAAVTPAFYLKDWF